MFTSLPTTSRNLIITGYVEPNKPRIAQQVAERLSMRFVDVEREIEGRMGDSMENIRMFFGERRLKTVEDDVMRDVALNRSTVIRVNGSTLAKEGRYARLYETGPVVCLVARLDSILQRVHLSLGARYHDPAERATELGKLRREWVVRRKPGIHEIDATYSTEPEIIADIVQWWQRVSIERV